MVHMTRAPSEEEERERDEDDVEEGDGEDIQRRSEDGEEYWYGTVP